MAAAQIKADQSDKEKILQDTPNAGAKLNSKDESIKKEGDPKGISNSIAYTNQSKQEAKYMKGVAEIDKGSLNKSLLDVSDERNNSDNKSDLVATHAPQLTKHQRSIEEVDTNNQRSTEAVQTAYESSTEVVYTTVQNSLETVGTTDQSSTNTADTTNQSSTEAFDTIDQTTTETLDTRDQSSEETLDTRDQSSTETFDTTYQSSTEEADTTDQRSKEPLDITDQSPTHKVGTTDRRERFDAANESSFGSSGTLDPDSTEPVNHRRLQSVDERRSARHTQREQIANLISTSSVVQANDASYETHVVDVSSGVVAIDARDLEARDGGGEVWAPFHIQLFNDENQPSTDEADEFLAGLSQSINNSSDRVFAEMISIFGWGRNDHQPWPDLCVLCWTRRPDVIFFQCHHVLICRVCVRECRVCPRCSEDHYAIFDPDYAGSS